MVHTVPWAYMVLQAPREVAAFCEVCEHKGRQTSLGKFWDSSADRNGSVLGFRTGSKYRVSGNGIATFKRPQGHEREQGAGYGYVMLTREAHTLRFECPYRCRLSIAVREELVPQLQSGAFRVTIPAQM